MLYTALLPRLAENAYANVPEMNDSTVGNQTTFSVHSLQIEMKPERSPKASRTQA